MQVKEQKAIEILTDDLEAVRKLPDVYIGALGNAGFKNMVREIFQNSLDVIIKKYTLDMNVVVSYDERNHTVIVEDNGPGIPLDMLEQVFSVLHSSSNYDKEEGSGEYSAGKNGMGATITNYLSAFFIAESYRADGTALRVEFNEGRVVKVEPIKKHTKKSGLIVSFAPSSMMGIIDISHQEIYDMIWLITHLCSIGTTVTFNLIDSLNRKSTDIIVNKNGIYDILNRISNPKSSVINPIYFVDDNGTMKAEILFTYNLSKDVDNIGESSIYNFANMCPTDGGTHVKGFTDALVKYFRDYMNKIYLVNSKKKLTVTANDIMTGLNAVVSVYHIHGLFEGQAKNVFSKEDMKPYITDVTIRALNDWSSKNPNDLQKLCKYFRDICEIRSKMDGEKIKMSDKFTASVVSGYPTKYKKPNGNKDIEVIIAEGDSAAGGMENNRDKLHQGIFPIRGKIINCLTHSRKQFFENEEVAGMFNIFGYKTHEAKFDPAKFKPSKVIIATDADADGKHIECLLLSMFLLYLPFVITEGKLYSANPPLYGIPIGGKMKFFIDNIEYIEYIQDRFCKEYNICDKNNKKLTKKDITLVLYKNMDYIKYINHLSGKYKIDPQLLELILYNYKFLIHDFKKFKKVVESQYKFLTVSNENGIIMIRGLIGNNIQTVFSNMLMQDPITNTLVDMINNSDNYYYINGNKSTLYQLMITFNKFEPSNLTRYKGLGEMPPSQLGLTTVLPGMGRTLKQYTIDDVKKQLEYIKAAQNDKSAFIKNIGTIRREDII